MSENTCVVLAVKTSDDKDYAKVLVRREAEYVPHRNSVVTSASIILNYECFSHRSLPTSSGNVGRFWGCYNSVFNTVSITSSSVIAGGVFIDPDYLRGYRLGTYLMNEVVSWVKQWPDANVSPVRVYKNEDDEENTRRRNKFYQQFGLVFDYEDERCQAGVSRLMKARDLTNVSIEEKCQNITVYPIKNYLRQSVMAESDAKRNAKTKETLITELSKEVAILKSRKGLFRRVGKYFMSSSDK